MQLSELESQRKTLAAVMHGIASCSEFTASVLAHTMDDAVALFSTKRVRNAQRPLCRPMLAPPRPAPPRPRPARVVQTVARSQLRAAPWQVLSRRLRYLMTCPLDFEPVDDTKMSFERSHRDALLPVLRQVWCEWCAVYSAFRLLRELLAMAWPHAGMLWPYGMLWCVMHPPHRSGRSTSLSGCQHDQCRHRRLPLRLPVSPGQ